MCTLRRATVLLTAKSCRRKKGLTNEEALVLSHIQAAGTEGEFDPFPDVLLLIESRDLDEAHQGQNRASPDCHRPMPQVPHTEAARQGSKRNSTGMY